MGGMGLGCWELTSIELALIVDHEHDLPLKDVAVHQAATYAGNVLVGLHLLQLPAEEAGCGHIGGGRLCRKTGYSDRLLVGQAGEVKPG